jgi:hypothetical protein
MTRFEWKDEKQFSTSRKLQVMGERERHITGVGLIECKLYSIDSDIQCGAELGSAIRAYTVRLE